MSVLRNIYFHHLLTIFLLCCGSELHAQTDLALHKAVTASTSPLPASYAVDGNSGTRWASNPVDPSWLKVDLGSNHSLDNVVIDWEAANAANYRVEGSTDDNNWTVLATRTGGVFGNRTDTVPVSGSYRYVRIFGTARTSGYGYSIWSLKVYGARDDDTPDQSNSYGHTVLANNSVRFYANNATWADIHYTINDGPQQNIRMDYHSDYSNAYTLSSIPANAVVKYFFTINNLNGSTNDTPWNQFTCCSSSDLPDSYVGYTGVYPGYTLKLDERFDFLNTAIWKKGDGAVGHESMCRFTDNGVQVSNGLLEFTVRNEYVPGSWSVDHKEVKRAYNYSCGELRTVSAKRIKYGRVEARMKTPSRSGATGYVGSLFTYVHEGNPRKWEEIDIELEGGRPDMMQANLIYGEDVPNWEATRRWGAWEEKINTGPTDQWRVFAFEWTPTEIRWYVDGKLERTLSQNQLQRTPVPDNLADLMMNLWIPNDDVQGGFGGNKYGNVYPLIMQYDWVRIYSLDSHPLQNW